MTDSRDAGSSWKSAGEKLSDLGATLKSHYDRQRADDAPARTEVSDAMKKLAGVLQDAADAARVAAKDPAVKHDLKDVGRTLGSALGATAEQVAVEVKRAFDQRQAGKPAEASEPVPPVATGTPAGSGDVWTETADTTAGAGDTPAPRLSDPPQDPPRPNTPPPAQAPQVPPGSADPSI